MSETFPYFRTPHDFYRRGYAAELGPFASAIYFCLLSHENHKTKDCFPSEETIAKKTGMTRNSVRKHITSLLDFGIIERIKKSSRSSRIVFHYKINPPNRWVRKQNDICAPHEQESNSDVHLVTDQCSPDAISYVHDVHTNKKELTKRNNNEKTVVNGFYMFGTDDDENELDASILPLEDDSQPCLAIQAPRLKRETTPESMRFVEKARKEIKTDDDRRKNDIATLDDIKEAFKRVKENC